MDTFRKQQMPTSLRGRAAAQSSMYFARKRNRAARALTSPVGEDRQREPIDNDMDKPIDNPDVQS